MSDFISRKGVEILFVIVIILVLSLFIISVFGPGLSPFEAIVNVREGDDGEGDTGGDTGGDGSDSSGGGYCGDRIVQRNNGEKCDDGNTINNDGCSAVCLIEDPPRGRKLEDFIKEGVLFDLKSILKKDILKKNEKIESVTTVTKLGENKSVEVFLNYFVKAEEDFEINIGEENVIVNDVRVVEKSFDINDGLKFGDYVFVVELTFEDDFASSANFFSLVRNFNYFWWLFLLLLIVIIIWIVYKGKKTIQNQGER